MKQIKFGIVTIAMLLCSGTIRAHYSWEKEDFEIDGIYYSINNFLDKTVSVVNPGVDYGYTPDAPYKGDVVIPETVTFENEVYRINKISDYAFYCCDELTSITLSDSIAEIGYMAFRGCESLSSIVLPKKLTYLSNWAFLECRLKEMYFKNSCTTSDDGSRFWGTINYIYVPQKSYYENTWLSENFSDCIIEYVSFDQNEFDYNGQVPTVAYTNNLSNKYELTMDVSNLLKDAGVHKTTFSAVYSNGLEVDIPYIYTINKAPLTIKVNDAEKVYGDENPQFTYSFSGFVNNEDESVLNSAVTFSTEANKKSGAGRYSVSASATAKNYEIGCTDGMLTVKKAPATVAVNAKSRIYGDVNPQFNFTYVGLKNGDGVPVFTSSLNTSTKATKYSDVGDYKVIVSGGVATNYLFTEYIPGTLTITQAPLNISVQSTVREYGEDNPEFQFAYSGFKNDDDADCLSITPIVVTSATPTSSVGEYEITPNGAEAKNYAISYTSGVLTVNKAPLTIQAENTERIYGEENPKFRFVYSGFKNDETYDVLTNRPVGKTEAVVTSGVGTYKITTSGAEAQNYAISYKNGTLTVTKAPLIVSAVDNKKEYGESNPVIELAYSGFKNSDNEECITKKPTITINADKKSNVGEYSITLAGGSAQNYEFTVYNEGKLTVDKAPLSVIAENKERLYFEANPELTFHCEGFKNDDTESVFTTQPSFECNATQTSSVGEYTITVSGVECKNYDLTYQEAILTVGKRMIDVTVGDYTRIYGEENPEFAVSYSGFVNNESEKVLAAVPVVACVADKTGNVGTYEITASGADAANYNFTYHSGVLTIEKATQEIVWEQDLSEVHLGDQVELTASATSGLTIEYQLASNNFVSIYEANGKVYLDCSGVGQVVIKAIQNGNKNYHAAIIVSKTLVVPVTGALVTGITLSQSSATIVDRNTLTLTATIAPVYATNPSLTWSSSDEDVATVTGGKVTAIAPGTATITATANDGSGVSASCMVTVEEATYVKITVSQYGSGTYCSSKALDFSAVEGLKAYVAAGYNNITGVVTLMRVNTTQAGVGLFVKGEPGTYEVPVMSSSPDNTLNMLVGTLAKTSVNALSSDGLYANYKYTIKSGDAAPLFHRFADGSTLSAGKAYLQIPVAWLPAEAKSISLRFDEGETTDMEEMESEQSSGVIYDLMGRRVVAPQRGSLYLIDGKKIIY